MGHQAAQLLLDRVTGALDSERQNIVLPTQLIIRASSGQCLAS
jgi:DNA-binding LacI/PurR family transcriptional regulator